MQSVKLALTILLVAAVAAAPCSLGAKDMGGGGSSVLSTGTANDTAVCRVDSEGSRPGLRMPSDQKLDELAARAEAAATGSSSGGGGHKKTLIIVGAVVLVAVLLAVSIRESCKKQGAECLK